MTDFTTTWSTVTRLLQTASNELRVNHDVSERDFGQFEEFLAHNELGLAWDELAECGDNSGGRSFWLLMSDAAREMGLEQAEAKAVAKAGVSRLTA